MKPEHESHGHNEIFGENGKLLTSFNEAGAILPRIPRTIHPSDRKEKFR